MGREEAHFRVIVFFVVSWFSFPKSRSKTHAYFSIYKRPLCRLKHVPQRAAYKQRTPVRKQIFQNPGAIHVLKLGTFDPYKWRRTPEI